MAISPEEKLLKLIRKGKDDAPGAKKAVDVPSSALSPVSAPKTAYNFFKFNPGIIMPVFFTISVIYFIASFVYPIFAFKNIKLPQVSQRKDSSEKALKQNEIKPYQSYLDGIFGRQIFKTAPTIQEAAQPLGSTDVDLIKDIALVGIIADNDPQAIIQDKKQQKIFYVRKGQFVGGFQLEDVQEGKIILNRDGQRFELNL